MTNVNAYRKGYLDAMAEVLDKLDTEGITGALVYIVNNTESNSNEVGIATARSASRKLATLKVAADRFASASDSDSADDERDATLALLDLCYGAQS